MKIFAGLAILLTLSTSVLAEGLSSVSFLPCYKSEGTSSFVTGLTENPDLSFVADRGVAIVSYNSAQGKQELRNTLQKVP
ncbi:MAG: hypothetical protein ACXWQE_13030, partial [Bdellovibrionales bacterium]